MLTGRWSQMPSSNLVVVLCRGFWPGWQHALRADIAELGHRGGAQSFDVRHQAQKPYHLATPQHSPALCIQDWGEIFIGCAGGGDSLLHIPVEHELAPNDHYEPQLVRISGLMGGHSGDGGLIRGWSISGCTCRLQATGQGTLQRPAAIPAHLPCMQPQR